MIISVAALLFCLNPTAIDGDTLRCGDSVARIRMFGINAPERGATGYIEAKASLQELANGGVICAVQGASYNRVVALCNNGKNEDLGRIQIDRDHAVEDCKYSKNFYGSCPE